jgi:hypothetical protein
LGAALTPAMHDRVNGTRRRLARLGALAPALARTLRAYGAPEQRLQSSGRRAALAELGYRQVQLCSGPLQRQALALICWQHGARTRGRTNGSSSCGARP